MPGTVLAANNYSLENARDDWLAGRAPITHLWGTEALSDAGINVVRLPRRSRGVAARLSQLARDRLGELGVERLALSGVRQGADALYAADPQTFAGLALARSWGRLRTPMLAVVHPNAWRGRGKLRGLQAYDEVLTLSTRVRDELVHDVGRRNDQTTVLPWGPDLNFAGYQPTGDDLIVCTGKSQRDTTTLLAALDEAGLQARVHVKVPVADYTGRSEVVVGAPYKEVLADLCRASVVAIPLASATQGSGLTELNDALALSKPVLMTRNPYIDVDIEAIGCGMWVPLRDVSGWRRALQEISADAAERKQRGELGRLYAQEHHNAELFGAGVVDVLQRLLPA